MDVLRALGWIVLAAVVLNSPVAFVWARQEIKDIRKQRREMREDIAATRARIGQIIHLSDESNKDGFMRSLLLDSRRTKEEKKVRRGKKDIDE